MALLSNSPASNDIWKGPGMIPCNAPTTTWTYRSGSKGIMTLNPLIDKLNFKNINGLNL